MTTASRLATIAGTCIASTLAVGLGGCAETERVTLNSLPVEVRAPLDNAMSYRGKVTEIERQVREEGPRVYVTYATVDNQDYRIEIDENGKLLSKEPVAPGEHQPSLAKMTSDPDSPPWKWW